MTNQKQNLENLLIFDSEPKTKWTKIVGGIIFGGILATGTVLAARVWDPMWNPFRPEPERVITKMSVKMGELKTWHNDFNLELETDNKYGPQTDVTTNISIDNDVADPRKLKLAGSYNTIYSLNGTQLSSGIEFMVFSENNSIYMKLTAIPRYPINDIGLEKIWKQLKDQWILFDKESLKGWQQEELKSAEDQEKPEKLKIPIADKELYTIKKELPDEKINETNVYHYEVILNKERLKKIILEVFQSFFEAFGGQVSLFVPGSAELEGFEQNIDKFFEKAGEIPAEVLIVKKDNFLYQFKVEKSFNLDKNNELADALSVKLDINFSKAYIIVPITNITASFLR